MPRQFKIHIMKKWLYSGLLSLGFLSACSAETALQHNNPKISRTSQSEQTTGKKVLNGYYGLKNALVSGNAAEVASKAKLFSELLQTANADDLTDKQKKALNTWKPVLLTVSNKIAGNDDLKQQRILFAELSESMISFIKTYGLDKGTQAYVQYCPMKKAQWLSDKKEIENPYYGSEMLSCGKITETLK